MIHVDVQWTTIRGLHSSLLMFGRRRFQGYQTQNKYRISRVILFLLYAIFIDNFNCIIIQDLNSVKSVLI